MIGKYWCKEMVTKPAKNYLVCVYVFFVILVTAAMGFQPVFQGVCEGSQNLCDQQCQYLGDHTFKCGCKFGYNLQPDGTTCIEASSHVKILEHDPAAAEAVQEVRRSVVLSTVNKTSTKIDEKIPPGVPQFSGNSFVSFHASSVDIFLLTNVSLQFKLQSAADNSGLLVYAGLIGASDFLALELIAGNIVLRVQFRVDCGEGVLELQYPGPLKPNQWHSVKAFRYGCTEIRLQVNAEEDSYLLDTSKAYHGINYSDQIWLGGLPEVDAGWRSMSKTGFSGCIRKLEINGQSFLDNSLQNNPVGLAAFQNIGSCARDACNVVECESGGVCSSTNNDKNEFELFQCLCPLGRGGRLCEKEVAVHVPKFSGESYLKHYAPSDLINYLELHIKFKPKTISGILFYAGDAVREEYLVIYLKKSILHLQFDLGSGSAVIRSSKPVSLNEWHSLEAWRSGRGGLLKLDAEDYEEQVAMGGFSKLHVGEFLYLGGVPTELLPLALKNTIESGLSGCVEKVILNGHKLHLVRGAVSGVNVEDCNTSPCAQENVCHQGSCSAFRDSFVCLCPFPYTGQQCNSKLAHEPDSFWFGGFSYVKIDRPEILQHIIGWELDFQATIKMDIRGVPSSKDVPVFPSQSAVDDQTIAFAQGVSAHSDYFNLGVDIHGHVRLRIDLGSGKSTVYNNRTTVDDGHWHKVAIKRSGRKVSLLVDNSFLVTETVAGSAKEPSAVYKTLFIGGQHEKDNSIGLPRFGFVGCITQIRLGTNFRIHNLNIATETINVNSCS